MDAVRRTVLEERHHAGEHPELPCTVDDHDDVAGKLGTALAGHRDVDVVDFLDLRSPIARCTTRA